MERLANTTSNGATVNASLITGLAGAAGLALSGNNLYAVTDVSNGTVGEYDATSGAAINATLVTGLSSPQALALSGNNLYVTNAIANGFVGLYDATTGAAINTSLVTGQYYSEGIAISGNNLYVPSQENLTFGNINEYDATTGAVINAPLISGLLHAPEGLVVSGNILYEANATNGTIGKYNATTGAVIQAPFISGLSSSSAFQLALLGNDLFVSDYTAGTIGVYNATTGATINASLVSGLNGPFGLAVVVPNPGFDLLATVPLQTNANAAVVVNEALNKIYTSGGASTGQDIVVIDGVTFATTDVGTGSGANVDVKTDRYWAATVSGGGIVVRDGRTRQRHGHRPPERLPDQHDL